MKTSNRNDSTPQDRADYEIHEAADRDSSDSVSRRNIVAALAGAVGVGALAAACEGGESGGPEFGRALAALGATTGDLAFVDVVASLDTSTALGVEVIVLLGYYSTGDGGGGVFYWDPTLGSADDDGGTIFYTSGTSPGCWVRVYSGEIDVKWFGAYSNNTAATATTAAIQAAIDLAAVTGGTVILPPGTYRTNATLNLLHNVYLAGLSRRKSRIAYNGDSAAISVVGSASDIVYGGGLRNLTVTCQNTSSNPVGLYMQYTKMGWTCEDVNIFGPDTAPNAGTAIHLDGSAHENTFGNVTIYRWNTGIHIQYNDTLTVGSNTNKFTDVKLNYIDGMGIYIDRCDGNTFFNVNMEHSSCTDFAIKILGDQDNSRGHSNIFHTTRVVYKESPTADYVIELENCYQNQFHGVVAQQFVTGVLNLVDSQLNSFFGFELLSNGSGQVNFDVDSLNNLFIGAEDWGSEIPAFDGNTIIDLRTTSLPGASQADSTATDVAGLVSDFNNLLSKLRAAGVIDE